MSVLHRIDLTCHAKVNLALSVGARDQSGLHPIASWMVAVVFGDRLSIALSRNKMSDFDIAYDPQAPTGKTVNWPLEEDLAYRAHALMQRRSGRPLPIVLTLRKMIPPRAGLGGGSSNAAAVLVALNQLHDLGLHADALVRLGQQLGSDVAFLIRTLQGNPSGLVSGHGESIEPIRLSRPLHLVLILPPFECPTAPVYRQFDATHQSGSPESDIAAVRRLANRTPIPMDGLFNDLAEPASLVQPKLGLCRQELHRKLGQPVHVTGSGAGMFLIATDTATAKLLAQRVTAATGLPAVPTHTFIGSP